MCVRNRISFAFGVVLLVAALVVVNFGRPVEPVNASANPETIEVIASGLNNPRGINFGPEGALYVAEAGSGGGGPCAEGPEGLRCYGTTGSITRIDLRSGTSTRIATDLPSLAIEDGSFAIGVHDISFQGRGNGFFTIGFSGDPAARTIDFGAAGASLARLARMNASGNWNLHQDLGA